nr:hypothetical protein CFP56_33006 [Quercus suber]
MGSLLNSINGIPKIRQKPWRFEHMWLEEEGCKETIEEAWSLEANGHAMARVEGKIGRCQSKLKWWSRMAIGNITRQLKEKKEQLRKAKDAAIVGKSMGGGSSKVISPRVPELEGAKVSALISSATGTWDQTLLHQHFFTFEAQRIMAIPLCITNQRDVIIWPGCPNGEYSVKSGYKQLCEEENVSMASASNVSL